MFALNAIRKILEPLPIRGKGRLGDFLLQHVSEDEVECRPVSGVRVFLRPSQRIERLMWAGAYERKLVRLFKNVLKPGMTALDLGANIGYFSAIAAGVVGSSGGVHSFEPVPETFARLQRNVERFPWCHTYRLAVAGAAGNAAIYFNEREAGWASLESGRDLSKSVTVHVTTLDDWALNRALFRLDFVKMDIEGGELNALKGALRVLRVFRPVIASELNAVCLGRRRQTPEDVLDFLRAERYRTFSFNDGLLAIPEEHNPLSSLQTFTKHELSLV